MFGSSIQKKLDKRMMNAIKGGNLDKLKDAVKDGANINEPQGYGASPVYCAVSNRQAECLAFLLEKGASITSQTGGGYFVSFIRAAELSDVKAMETLLQRGANINGRDYAGRTALHTAARNGDGKVVRWLLDKKADATATDDQMNTPADLAERSYPRVADLLRETVQAATATRQGWRMTDVDEVALVTDKQAIGYRVTEIFNFSARLYSKITRSLETNAESQSVLPFSALEEGTLIEQAKKAFLFMGGQLPDAMTQDEKTLMKPPRQMKGAQL